MVNFFQRLMRETRGPHKEVEATDFFVRMREEVLTLDEYEIYFQDLAAARKVLETEAYDTRDGLSGLLGGGQRRYDMMAADLDFLYDRGTSHVQPVSAVETLATHLRGIRDPLAIVGHFLALEGGVAMGGQKIVERMQRRFPVFEEGGLSYFQGRGDEPSRFFTFASHVDTSTTDTQKDAIIAETSAAFSYLATMLHERGNLLG